MVNVKRAVFLHVHLYSMQSKLGLVVSDPNRMYAGERGLYNMHLLGLNLSRSHKRTFMWPHSSVSKVVGFENCYLFSIAYA